MMLRQAPASSPGKRSWQAFGRLQALDHVNQPGNNAGPELAPCRLARLAALPHLHFAAITQVHHTQVGEANELGGKTGSQGGMGRRRCKAGMQGGEAKR